MSLLSACTHCIGRYLLLVLLLGIALAGQAQPAANTATWQWVQPLQAPELGGMITAAAVARDRAGDLYLTGRFSGTVLLGRVWLRGQARQLGQPEQEASFVARLAPDGRCRWASALPVPAGLSSTGESIAVDGTGHLWVSGNTFRPPGSAPDAPTATTPGYFIAHLDSMGRLQWQQPLQLPAGQESCVGADAQGHGYVNGGPATAGPGPTAQPLASRLDAAGHWEWAVAAGPGLPLHSLRLAVGPGGELYLAGQVARAAPAQPPRPTKTAAPVVPPFQGVVLALRPDGRRNWQALVPEASTLNTLSVGPTGELVAAGNRELPVKTRFYSTRRPLNVKLASREMVITGLSAGGQRRWLSRAAAHGTYYDGPGLYSESTLMTQHVSIGPDGDVWLSSTLKGSATFPTTPAQSQSSGSSNTTRAPNLLLAHLNGQGRWQAVQSLRPFNGWLGSGNVVAGAGIAYMVQAQNEDLSGFNDQPAEHVPLVAMAANQPGQWQPLLSVECGQGESELQALAPGPDGWLVAGRLTNRLRLPDGKTVASDEDDVLTGQLTDNGSWQWLRAGGLILQHERAEVHHAAADSSGRLVVTGRYRTSLEGQPTPIAGSLRAELTRLPQVIDTDTRGFVGQVDRAGRWLWAQNLVGNYDDELALAVAANGQSWVAFARSAQAMGDWGRGPGTEVVLQQRDDTGRLLVEKVLGRGTLRSIRLVPGPGKSCYLAGEVADSLALTTAQGPVSFRPLPLPATQQQQLYERVLLRVLATGRVEWARSLGSSLQVEALVPAPGGDLWLAADLIADSVVVPTQPPGHFRHFVESSGDEHSSYLLSRVDSAGTWRWARQVLGSAPVIAADAGDRLVIAGSVINGALHWPAPDTTQPAPPARLDFSQISAQGQVLAEWSPKETLPGQRINALQVAANGDPVLAGKFYGISTKPNGYVARLHPVALSAPVVRQLAPTKATRGSVIAVIGTGLEQVRRVLLNDVAADFETISSQQLRVRIPTGLAPGPVRVVVQTGTASIATPGQLRLR